MSEYQQPDASGHFGKYGGSFVSETLTHAINQLREAYAQYQHDPEFLAEFKNELAHFVGRPSPIYHAARTSREHPTARELMLFIFLPLALSCKAWARQPRHDSAQEVDPVPVSNSFAVPNASSPRSQSPRQWDYCALPTRGPHSLLCFHDMGANAEFRHSCYCVLRQVSPDQTAQALTLFRPIHSSRSPTTRHCF